jgi:hypothetical protein
LLTGILSFLGVVIGASLQYYFTRHIENQRHLRDLRSKAYMDYLNCVTDLAQFRPKENSKERIELSAKTGDAKARICLYGSNKAITAFSQFEELGATMNTDEQRQSFTNMVSIMRMDSGSEGGVNSKALQNVLLGIHK